MNLNTRIYLLSGIHNQFQAKRIGLVIYIVILLFFLGVSWMMKLLDVYPIMISNLKFWLIIAMIAFTLSHGPFLFNVSSKLNYADTRKMLYNRFVIKECFVLVFFVALCIGICQFYKAYQIYFLLHISITLFLFSLFRFVLAINPCLFFSKLFICIGESILLGSLIISFLVAGLFFLVYLAEYSTVSRLVILLILFFVTIKLKAVSKKGAGKSFTPIFGFLRLTCSPIVFSERFKSSLSTSKSTPFVHEGLFNIYDDDILIHQKEKFTQSIRNKKHFESELLLIEKFLKLFIFFGFYVVFLNAMR